VNCLRRETVSRTSRKKKKKNKRIAIHVQDLYLDLTYHLDGHIFPAMPFGLRGMTIQNFSRLFGFS
jgi:hypothetical protein